MNTAQMDRDLNIIGLLRHSYGIIDKGWCQLAEKTQTPEGWQYCAFAALKKSSSNLGRVFRSRIIIEQQVLGGANLLRFNDAPGRTKEEVLEVFDRAIDFVTQEISQHIQDNESHTSGENDTIPGSL